MAARISSELAVSAAQQLFKDIGRSPRAFAESSWDERVAALDAGGYARYRERTATLLGEVTDHLHERWDGDLRKLRDAADRKPAQERRLLKEFKGIGDVGVDIFFREAAALVRAALADEQEAVLEAAG